MNLYFYCRTVEWQCYAKPVYNVRIQRCDNVIAMPHDNVKVRCVYTVVVVTLQQHCELVGVVTLYMTLSRCHNIVTMLYTDVVYITLSFNCTAINMGVHEFMSRELQATTSSFLRNLVNYCFEDLISICELNHSADILLSLVFINK